MPAVATDSFSTGFAEMTTLPRSIGISKSVGNVWRRMFAATSSILLLGGKLFLGRITRAALKNKCLKATSMTSAVMPAAARSS
eukprot:786873-Amphidinium_carterae.1